MPDNSERNRALHELVKPGECWHTWKQWTDMDTRDVTAECSTCKESRDGVLVRNIPVVNYFDADQPHSQVVALVKAAVERFGQGRVREMFVGWPGLIFSVVDLMQIPAPEIAEAIYNLIEAERTRVSEKVAAASKEMMEDGEEY